MAISFVGGRTAEWGGNTTPITATFGSGLSGGLSSTPSAGDFVVLWAGYSTTFTSSGLGVTWGSGGAPSIVVGSTLDFVRIHTLLAYGFIDSTKLANGTLSITNSITAANASGTWIIKVYRGVDAATPLDVALVNASGLNTSTPAFASITPVTSGARIIAMAGGGASSTTSPYTSSLSNFFADQRDSTNTYRNHTGSGDFTSWSSGSYTPSTWGGGVGDVNHCYYSVTMALRPAPTGPSGDVAVTLDAATLSSSVTLDVIVTVAQTLDAATLSSVGSVTATGALAVTLDDFTLAGVGSTVISVELSVTLAGATVDAIVGQVGDGSTGDLLLVLGDAALDATVTLSVAADLVATLADAAAASFVLAGSQGPFQQRPLMIVN